MFLSLMLTGCEEDLPEDVEDFLDPTPNHITVTVQASARAYFEHTGSNGIVVTSPNTGVGIQIEIQKARGENVVFERTTNDNGYTDVVVGTFDVYKEQPVEVWARPQGFEAKRGYKIFTWDMLWHIAGQEFGQSITVTALNLEVVTEILT